MTPQTKELQQLINKLASGAMVLIDFKQSAMQLARNAADLTVQGTIGSKNTLLHCLALTNEAGINDKEISELLILQKDKLNAKSSYGKTALTSLIDEFINEKCSLEDFKRTAMLLAHGGADLTVQGSVDSKNTLLHCLALTNEGEINDKEITKLVELKSDIFNIQDGFGRLPIEALLRQQPQISIDPIIKLIKLGNALHYKNASKETLIHISCIIGNLELVQYLVSNGLDINAKTKLGRTSLHCSASTNNEKLWEYLYGLKVDINAQDTLMRTALHHATQNNNIAMVIWLTRHNADIQVRDVNDETALAIAQKKEAKDIIEFLLTVQLFTKELDIPNEELLADKKNTSIEIIVTPIETQDVSFNIIPDEGAVAPVANRIKTRDSTNGSIINPTANRYLASNPSRTEETSSSTDISMMVLGGFIAAAGIAAVAIAFTLLNAATFGVAGLIVAGTGVAATLCGMGLFATRVYKNSHNSGSNEPLPFLTELAI